MRLSLQTVMCCCVFTTVVPLIRGDPVEPHGALKKRFREWLQSHMSRDPHTQLSAAAERTSVGPEQNQDGEASLQSASFGGNIRSKRSAGCSLATCSIHVTFETVYKSNIPKPCAPQGKIGPDGFGRRRRRRSTVGDPQLTLLTERPATSSEKPCSKDKNTPLEAKNN
uniref:Adrenomedullin n=1 Tax=Poecilia formosa TaxID=48698 RepID=A0A087XUI7_POEFO